MITFKEALCLLAIVVAYGITGRMDYDDAVMLEQAELARASAGARDRESAEPLTAVGRDAQASAPAFAAQFIEPNAGKTDTGDASASPLP